MKGRGSSFCRAQIFYLDYMCLLVDYYTQRVDLISAPVCDYFLDCARFKQLLENPLDIKKDDLVII
jgi:hypothetical protein